MIVHEYEIEMRLHNRNTRATTLVCRTEFTYSPIDAYQQAIMHVSAEPETGSAEISLVRIGPPKRIIEASARDLDERIEQALLRIVREHRVAP